MKIRIATRRSDLALWQAHHVAGRLRAAGAETELVELVTRGDRIDDVPLSTVEGKGFFTKEIEDALLERRADLAVHSHKDLAVEAPPGLTIVAVPARARTNERLLVAPAAHAPEAPFLPLRAGARVGTSAPRRAQQLRALRPDLEVLDLRGNVPTRVQRLRDGRYDAIVLAAAGLDRLALDVTGLVTVDLPIGRFVPAPAQGALGIQARAGDTEVIELARRALHDEATERVITAERALLTRLGGGCSLPFGAAIVAAPDGGWRLHAFLGRDHPSDGDAPRWLTARGADLDAVVEEGTRRLLAAEPTGDGPLAGRRVALTGSIGPESDSPLAVGLATLGATVVTEPVIAFEDVPCAGLHQHTLALRPGDGLAVTSREAARRLVGLSVPAGVHVAAVGAATARALETVGIHADHVGSGGARELAETWELGAGARVLFPCAQGARLELEETLAARGIEVERMPIYRTVPVGPAERVELDAEVDLRVYMSPSAVDAAAAWEREHSGADTVRVALGPTTGEALQRAGLAFEMPERTGGSERTAGIEALAAIAALAEGGEGAARALAEQTERSPR